MHEIVRKRLRPRFKEIEAAAGTNQKVWQLKWLGETPRSRVLKSLGEQGRSKDLQRPYDVVTIGGLQ